jgi:23S rRNA G2069 N7-methylase RlmK/C1962 C5-methylase RlmI
LLNPGGFLITCSCSYNVDEAMFAEAVFEASVDSHIPVTVVEKTHAGARPSGPAGRPGNLLLEELNPPETGLK